MAPAGATSSRSALRFPRSFLGLLVTASCWSRCRSSARCCTRRGIRSASPSRAAARCTDAAQAATRQPLAGEPHRLDRAPGAAGRGAARRGAGGRITRGCTRASASCRRSWCACRSTTSSSRRCGARSSEEQALYDLLAGARRRGPMRARLRRAWRRAGRERATRCWRSATWSPTARWSACGASAEDVQRRLICMVLLTHRGRARDRARADARHRAADRRARRLDPPAGQRRFRAADPRQRAAGPARPGRAAGLAAPSTDRARGAEEPLPAPLVA